MSFVQALGAVPPPTRDLQVKKYPNGWASYQSPYSNEVLRGLQRELNRFGSGLAVDGVIGASTVTAVRRIAEQYRPSSYGNIAANLGTIAEGGAELVAKKGEYARYFVSLLADKFATGSSGPTAEQRDTADRSSGGGSSSGGGTYYPPVVTPGTPIVAAMPAPSPNKMLMAAGAVVVGALIIKEMRKGKRSTARTTRRRR